MKALAFLDFVFFLFHARKSGQREGLLTEAPAEEADQADPFYANCKLHCDKTQAR